MDMTSPLIATLFFIALFALIQIPMTIRVGLRRLHTQISFLDGGDETLLRRYRAHGNFTETVPITLFAMAAAELSGAPSWLIWTGGGLLLAGRLLHYATLVSAGWGNGRAIGMMLTMTPMAVFPAFVLLRLAGVF